MLYTLHAVTKPYLLYQTLFFCARYLDGNTEAAAHKGIAAREEIRKSKSKADGAYEDDFQR